MRNAKNAWAVRAMLAAVVMLGAIAQAQPMTRPAGATTAATANVSAAVMLEKGIYTEQTLGDLDAAVKIYRQIVDQAKTNRKYAAQAQYRLGMCYLKKKQSADAIREFTALAKSFPDQKDLAARARAQIENAKDALSDAEIEKTVEKAVTDISTMAETDPRLPAILASLGELKEPDVVRAVTKYLASDKKTVRRAAIYVIWKAGFSDPAPAVPGLKKLCSHAEDLTRGMAALCSAGRRRTPHSTNWPR